MPQNPQVEYDAFIRWLATNPHKIAEYEADPAGFLAAANVGEIVQARVRAVGVDGLRRAIREDADRVASSIDDPNFGRDATVQGFGARKPGS